MGQLDDIPAGTTVVVDSTILHYACVQFEPATAQCIRFLSRVAAAELTAGLSIPILNDAVHKVMCSEAVERFGRPRAGLVAWMKRNAERVRELTRARELLHVVEALPLRVLPMDTETLFDAQRKVSAYGLLASDAMILALMEKHGVTDLATNDDDFDRVTSVRVWKPR